MKQQQVLVWWLAVSLTIGMTSISSAEGDNDDRKVLAFTLEDCNGNSREFENLKALEDFDKKSNNDSTGEDYESYMYVDDDSNTCHTLEDEDMEELTVVGERLPQDDEEIPDTEDIREVTIRIPRVNPEDVRSDDQDLAETNEKWKGCKNKITDVEGYDLEYEETDYTWEISKETGPYLGLTDPNTETVTIYTVNIAQVTPLGLTVPHLTMQTVIHEYIHTIQGRSGNPDEWLSRDVQGTLMNGFIRNMKLTTSHTIGTKRFLAKIHHLNHTRKNDSRLSERAISINETSNTSKVGTKNPNEEICLD
ncbi:MAG: hypothetical protein OXG88_02060 [Gammaproteobacteria bacterium]|nr:hypothetical protein [Gammaproteobacteria bacterium]